VLLEEGLGGATSRSTGHDVPGNDNRVLSDLLGGELLDLDDTLGLKLEEGLVGGKSNVEASLGGGRSETGSLSTGHQDNGNLAGTNDVETNVIPELNVGLGGIEDGSGSGGGEGLDNGSLGGGRRVESLFGEFLFIGQLLSDLI
jgi:hypothetical protein